MNRLLSAAFLSVIVSSAAVAGGCGQKQQTTFPASGDDDSDSGSMVGNFQDASDMMSQTIPGLTSIAITPAMSSLMLQYPVTAPGATTQLKAVGTFQNGSTSDVTTQVTWSVTPPLIASATGGAFASASPGTFTVLATAGMVTSSPATVTVTLTGNVVGMGVTQGDLDGTPSGTGPTIAYPLDGALFPYELGPIEFQVVPTSSAQTEARIAFEGDNIDLKVYEPCVPIQAPTMANACTITVPSDLEQQLDGASEGTNLTETVRLAAPGGGMLAESMPISARWSISQLTGGLYYWSASLTAGTTIIMRYNLSTPGTPPEQYFTDLGTGGVLSDEQNMDPPASSNSTTCFGCHSISHDGTKMGLTFGGSQPALFALIDVATKKTIATRMFTGDPNVQVPVATCLSSPDCAFAAFTTFSPDGTALVQSVGGQLWLRSADANLANLIPNALFGGQLGGDSASTPFWSPTGNLLAFTGWVPDPTAEKSGADPDDTNGDETPNAEIWTAPAMGNMTFGTPTKLVPGVTGKSEYYPAISDDGQYVVFNESSCNGPGPQTSEAYGVSPCDGYDDASATLRLVSSQGGAPVYLTKASQNGNWSNSWPRFAPTHGSFQGKNLYWIAFSSRNPYGATLAGTDDPSTDTMDIEPQLWFAAVTIDSSGMLSGDPSYAPVWMPQQNPAMAGAPAGMTPPARGNHSPQWVSVAVAVNQ